MTEVELSLEVAALSRQLEGLVVADLSQSASDKIALRFTSGSVLEIRATDEGCSAALGRPRARGGPTDRAGPTHRQRQYLEFIKKYMHRFGYSPAETDIQRRFLVSAPSVNQMVRTLERRGFIARDRDGLGQTVPRSIRVLWDG